LYLKRCRDVLVLVFRCPAVCCKWRTRYVLLLVVVAADTLDCRLIVWFHYHNMLVLEYYVMTRDAAYEKQMKR
jgi:hypothetical protein